jgi:hypothetical protein
MNKNPIDKFGDEIKANDMVSVQNAHGLFKIYDYDGELYFFPYNEKELVNSYFSNDLILWKDE